jgi:dTDP-4-dehydrorhamnose reductase
MTSQDIKLISSDEHPAAAKRPMNSRFNATKIKKTFMLKLPSWKVEAAAVIKIALINT